MPRDHHIHVSAEYTALEEKIEHIERVCRIELEQHARKCRAEVSERIDDAISYMARNMSSDSRHSSARLKDLSSDVETVKAEVRKSAGLSEAVESLSEKMKRMQSDIESLLERRGGGGGTSRSRSQGKAPTLETVEGHKDLKIVIDECLNLTKRVKALERGRHGGGGVPPPRTCHHAVSVESETEVRALGEEVRQCLAATVELRRYVDSAVARIEQRFTTLERSATGPDSSRSPRGMDNSNVLTTAAPEVTDLQSAFQSLREQIAEVSAGREELDHRLSTLERAAGPSRNEIDSKLKNLKEVVERNEEEVEILRENLAETRRTVVESIAADSPQLVSRVTALCEEKVSVLAGSLLQSAEICDKFQQMEARVSRDIASRYEALRRSSLDMVKEAVRKKERQGGEVDRQLRDQKANLNAVTKALEAFKETITESRVTGSRERDEFKADIVDLRLSLGVVEKRCERKIEEKMGGLERRVGVVEASRKRIEEGLREERVFVENMCRETSEEVSRVAGKCEEMMKKEREEIVGEVHRGIGEMERRLGVAVRGGEEAVERVEERLGKVEKEVKSSRRRNSGGNRVVTITASPSRLDEPSSSEDSYDEMQRDIKYEHICSRLKKLESVLPRVYEVEEKLREGQRQEVAMESAGVTREEVEELRRSVWKEVNLVREQLGEVAAEVRGESRKEGWADATGRARIEERVEEISKALQVMEFRVEELGRGSDGREFGGLRECVEEWVNRSEKLEAEVESLAGRQVEMGEEVKGMVRRMDGIEEGESRMGIVVERVEGEMAVLARAVAEVSDLRTSVDEISDFLSKFPRDGFKEDAQRSIEGLRSGLAEVRVEMEEVREVRHAMGRMGEVESRLGHVEANMEWVEGEFNAYKKVMEGMEGELELQKRQVEGMGGELLSQSRALRAVEGRLGSQEEVWEAEVSRNRETLERVEEELGLQKKQLEGIEPGLSANREALEGLTVTVGKLERRAMGAVAAVGPQEEGMEGSSGRRIRELEESVEELMALLGVVDDLAKNQTEMRKSLQSRYDRETAEMGAALRKEIGEVREAVAEGAVGVEELRRIVGKLEGRLRLDEEVVVDTVRGKQERLNGDDSARERLQVVGPDDGLWVERKELAAMKAQTRELQEAMDGSQERVEEWIESKLEVLQSELVERDSEWQKMVEEQVTEALGHIEGYVDPEIARLSSSLEGVAERLVNVEASVAEGMRMRREMEGMGKERRPLLSPYGVGEEARNVQLEDRLAACESALEETVGSAREVEGIRRELEKVSVMVARHEASITTTGRSPSKSSRLAGSGRDQEARILEMQNAIQTVHSRMCRLASAIRELYSDCRTSLSTNFPEAADALLQGGLRIPEWTDESLMHSMSNRSPSEQYGSRRSSPMGRVTPSPKRSSTPMRT